jgi:hypothetical protein
LPRGGQRYLAEAEPIQQGDEIGVLGLCVELQIRRRSGEIEAEPALHCQFVPCEAKRCGRNMAAARNAGRFEAEKPQVTDIRLASELKGARGGFKSAGRCVSKRSSQDPWNSAWCKSVVHLAWTNG